MSAHRLLTWAFFGTWLSASVRLAGPVLLAALGETFAENSGVLNVGIEGTILLGALAGFLAAYVTGMVWISLLAAILTGIFFNLFLAWMYVTVRASQVVVGLVFNVLALGIAATAYRRVIGESAGPQSVAMFTPLHIKWLSNLPLVGPALFGQTILLYLTVALAGLAYFVLFRTSFGLALRAAGENPYAADAAGISVARMRYIGVLIGGATAGAAGAYLVLAQVGLFRESIVAGQGFIALGIVIFGRWNPWKAALAALAFGACDALQLSLQLGGENIPPQLLSALPYLVTILAISGLFGGKAIQPDALMVPYAKE
ncbi:MAG: ABC transporter permease [Acidobacteriaceae bacterium]